jgi:hypothetical protein
MKEKPSTFYVHTMIRVPTLCPMPTSTLLRGGHPFCQRKVASQKGWPLKRGTFQCIFDSAAGKKWPLMRGASLKRGTTVYSMVATI